MMPAPVPRIALTADLHHDVARSRDAAENALRDLRDSDADALLLVGDTATSDGDALERALSRLPDDGRPRLFVPGNHELWSKQRRTPADVLLRDELPRRVRELGFHWLPGEPFRFEDGAAIVGSLGWYDHAFALPELALPGRFYDSGLAPGVAAWLGRLDLEPTADDVPDAMRKFFARWNDKRFIHALPGDLAFALEQLRQFSLDLEAVAGASSVLAAVHVVPLAELLPPVPPGPVPARRLKYAFARAYLGSPTFGEAALSRANVSHLVCGHSHFRRAVALGGVQCLNVGSTYVDKRVDCLAI